MTASQAAFIDALETQKIAVIDRLERVLGDDDPITVRDCNGQIVGISTIAELEGTPRKGRN